MKYAKMLGLLAAAVTALMAFAGIASATEVTSPPGTIYTGTIKAASEGTTTLHNTSIGISVSCAKSTVEAPVEQHGEGVTVKGTIPSAPEKKLTFTECGADTVTVLNPGSLEVHATGSGNGTLTSVGAEITIKTASGVSCTYTTGTGTDVGTLTGTTHQKTTGGKTATLDINSATIPRTGDSILCGTKGQWTGSYIVNTPDELDVS